MHLDTNQSGDRRRVRFSISWKLLAVTVVVGVVAVGIAVAGLQRISMLNERLSKTVAYSSENVKLAALLKQDLVTVTRAEKNMMLARSEEEMNRFTTTIDEKLRAMQANQGRLRELMDDEDKQRLDRFSAKWNEWKENHASVRSFAQLNSDVRARQIAMGQGRDSFEQLERALNELAVACQRNLESAMDSGQRQQQNTTVQAMKTLAGLFSNLAQLQRTEMQIILSQAEKEMQKHEQAFDSLQKQVESQLVSLRMLAGGSEEPAVAAATEALAAYVETVSEMRAFLGKKQNHFVHYFAYEIGGPLSSDSERLLDELIAKNERDMQVFREESEQTFVTARNSLLAFGAVGILVSVLVSFLIGQRIAHNLGRLAEYARQVKVSGDLSQPVPYVGRDEVGLLAESFDHMRQSLHQQTSELATVNDALAQKNEEIEQFVYTVSHDLKSPLVSCKGLVGLIKEDIADGDYQEVIASAERLDDATDQLNRIIDDLLNLSRIGRKSLELSEIDMAALVSQVAGEFSEQFEETGARLEVDANLPKLVADKTDVRRVFENLLSNALKYGCNGNDSAINVGGTVNGNRIRYCVRDNGPGIDPRYHQRIFGLFQRLDTDRPGTGVGLASVAKIVRMYGGRTWVDSKPGEGAAFFVEFPRRPQLQKTNFGA